MATEQKGPLYTSKSTLHDALGPTLLFSLGNEHYLPCSVKTALDRKLDGGASYRIVGTLRLSDGRIRHAFFDGKREFDTFVLSDVHLRNSEGEVTASYGKPGFVPALGGDPDSIFPITNEPDPALYEALVLSSFNFLKKLPQLFALEDALADTTLRETALEPSRNGSFKGVRKSKEDFISFFSEKEAYVPGLVITDDGTICGKEHHGYLLSCKGNWNGFVALDDRGDMLEATLFEECPPLLHPFDPDYDHLQVKLGGERVVFFEPKMRVSGFSWDL